MRKQLLFCFAIFIGYQSLSQKIDTANHGYKNMHVGIYKTYEEFLKDAPSIVKPFEFYRDTVIDYENHDTIIKSLSYKYIDGSRKTNNYWGLFDGNKVFVHVYRQGLIPLNYVGKNGYMLFQERNKIELLSFLVAFEAIIVSALDAVVSPQNLKLYYINDKGESILATAQSIAWLLKKDKILYDAFIKEKKLTYALFISYLTQLNEKYPLR